MENETKASLSNFEAFVDRLWLVACLVGRGWSFARFVYVDRGLGCPRNGKHVIHTRFYMAPDASHQVLKSMETEMVLVKCIIFYTVWKYKLIMS